MPKSHIVPIGNASFSVTQIPFEGLDILGAEHSGTLEISIEDTTIRESDVAKIIKDATNKAAHQLHMRPGHNQTVTQIYNLSVSTGTEIYITTASGAAANIQHAREVLQNGWYLGADGSTPEEQYYNWVDKIQESVIALGHESCIKKQLASDMKRLYNVLSLPLGVVAVGLEKIGDKGLRVITSNKEVIVEDIYAQKVPILDDLLKIARGMAPGETQLINRTITPEDVSRNTAIVRERGTDAQHATPERAQEIVEEIAIFTVQGMREDKKDPNRYKSSNKGKIVLTTLDGERAMIVKFAEPWHEAFVIRELSPQFTIVDETTGQVIES